MMGAVLSRSAEAHAQLLQWVKTGYSLINRSATSLQQTFPSPDSSCAGTTWRRGFFLTSNREGYWIYRYVEWVSGARGGYFWPPSRDRPFVSKNWCFWWTMQGRRRVQHFHREELKLSITTYKTVQKYHSMVISPSFKISQSQTLAMHCWDSRVRRIKMPVFVSSQLRNTPDSHSIEYNNLYSLFIDTFDIFSRSQEQ